MDQVVLSTDTRFIVYFELYYNVYFLLRYMYMNLPTTLLVTIILYKIIS